MHMEIRTLNIDLETKSGTDITKAGVATKAIPFCNIVCISGDEMKAMTSGYLQILFDANPASVGGTMPADDFYYGAN